MCANVKLFKYQEEGVEWLESRRFALLADEMGLGKTAQAIVAAKKTLSFASTVTSTTNNTTAVANPRILVICPAVARINWQREFNMWWPEHTVNVLTAPTYGSAPMSGPYQNSSIVSFEYATKYTAHLIVNKWDLVIIDEAHFLKSTDSKRALHILGKNGIVHNSHRTWALSGTPAPNHAGELWPLLRTFGVTNLSYQSFLKEFCNCFLGPHNNLVVTGTKVASTPRLRDMLKTISLRRMVKDVQKDLPSLMVNTLAIEAGMVEAHPQMSETEKKLTEFYNIFGENILENLTSMHEGELHLATFRRYCGLAKVEAVAALLEGELESNAYDKIVVFAIHKEVIDSLYDKLLTFNPVRIYGATTPTERQKAIDNFQQNKNCRVFFGNILAAGTAITLHAANQILFVEQDWVPGNNLQALKRVHRTGQQRPVNARFISLSESIDEKITETVLRKTREIEKII